MLGTPYFPSASPVQQNYLVGSALCLSVSGTGSQPLSYQAQLNGTSLFDNGRISGSQQPSICFSLLVYGDSGVLNMVMTNNDGTFTGLLANISITPIIGWGDNSTGQIAIPPSATNVIAVAGGGDHSLALCSDGSVVAWGDNTYGQNNVPPSAAGVVAIAEGDTHSMALKMDGTVIAWGDNSTGQTTVPPNVHNAVAIAAGSGNSQALLANGSIIAWGSRSNQIPSFATNILAISSRGNTSLALRADGVVIGWGGFAVPSTATNAVAIAAGASHSIALMNDGTVIAWGKNSYGQTNIPANVTNVLAIAAGDDHSIALCNDGSVIAWGNTNFNQSFVPTIATGIAAIGAGSIHSLAVIGQSFTRNTTPGQSVLFTSGSLGKGRANYQWQFNGTNIAGATNAALVLGNVSWINSGVYRVIVSNALGTATGQPIILNVQTPFQFDNNSFSNLPNNGGIKMRLIGSSGTNPVVIFASTNLLDWQAIFTNVPTVGPVDFTDAPPIFFPQRFYRAVESP